MGFRSVVEHLAEKKVDHADHSGTDNGFVGCLSNSGGALFTVKSIPAADGADDETKNTGFENAIQEVKDGDGIHGKVNKGFCGESKLPDTD